MFDQADKKAPPITVQKVEKFLVIEFKTPSLMDAMELERIGQAMYRLVDEEDHRIVVLDFEIVEYISSQAIGLILTMNKKLSALKKSRLILCGVNERLMQLLKITRLDKILTIKPSQREVLRMSV